MIRLFCLTIRNRTSTNVAFASFGFSATCVILSLLVRFVASVVIPMALGVSLHISYLISPCSKDSPAKTSRQFGEWQSPHEIQYSNELSISPAISSAL